MYIKLKSEEVGPWPMNTYLITCPTTQESAIVDPGADPEIIMRMAAQSFVKLILILISYRLVCEKYLDLSKLLGRNGNLPLRKCLKSLWGQSLVVALFIVRTQLIFFR